MKEIGIYDSATIIITGDHGRDEIDNRQITYLIKLPNEHQERMGVCSAPISHDDFQATILDILGQDYSEFGTSIFDWSENDQRWRELWVHDPEKNGFWIYSYVGNRDDLKIQMERGGDFISYPTQ